MSRAFCHSFIHVGSGRPKFMLKLLQAPSLHLRTVQWCNSSSNSNSSNSRLRARRTRRSWLPRTATTGSLVVATVGIKTVLGTTPLRVTLLRPWALFLATSVAVEHVLQCHGKNEEHPGRASRLSTRPPLSFVSTGLMRAAHLGSILAWCLAQATTDVEVALSSNDDATGETCAFNALQTRQRMEELMVASPEVTPFVTCDPLCHDGGLGPPAASEETNETEALGASPQELGSSFRGPYIRHYAQNCWPLGQIWADWSRGSNFSELCFRSWSSSRLTDFFRNQ
eukprot:g3179.t1